MNKWCVFHHVPSVGKQYTINLRLLLDVTLSTAISEVPLAALIIVAILIKFNLFLNAENPCGMDNFFHTGHL